MKQKAVVISGLPPYWGEADPMGRGRYCDFASAKLRTLLWTIGSCFLVCVNRRYSVILMQQWMIALAVIEDCT